MNYKCMNKSKESLYYSEGAKSLQKSNASEHMNQRPRTIPMASLEALNQVPFPIHPATASFLLFFNFYFYF